MEYKAKDRATGEIISVPMERWIWGAVFKCTPEAIAAAEKQTAERNAALKKELAEKEIQTRRSGAVNTRELIEQMRTEYDILMGMPVPPEQEEFKQFGDDGQYHYFDELDQSRVYMFTMYKPDFSKRIDVITDGAGIYHRYVNVVLSAGTPFETRARVYLFGAHGVFNYIMPDDTVVQCTTKDLNLLAYGLIK